MKPLKRIIYGIKVITKSGPKGQEMYNVIYYYFVQAVRKDEYVALNEDIYKKSAILKTRFVIWTSSAVMKSILRTVITISTNISIPQKISSSFMSKKWSSIN